MGYVLSIILQNISWIFDKSKFLKYLMIFISGFTLVNYFVGTDGRTTLDYSVYESQYYANSDYFERFYNLLVHLSNSVGLNYVEFRLSISIIAVIIFLLAIVRLTNNVSIAIMGYFISSYLVDIVQIRQFLMLGFILLGLSFLKLDSVVGSIFGYASMFVGTQFHSLGWIFFLFSPLVFVSLKKQREWLPIISGIILFIIALFYVLPKSLLLKLTATVLNLLSSRENIVDNVNTVYSNGSGIKVWFLLFVISMVALLIGCFSKNIVMNEKNAQVLMYSIYILLISILLTFMSVDYVRLSRSGVVLFVLFITNFDTFRNKVLIWSSVTFISILSIYLQIGVVYQTSGRMVPYLLHFINENIVK